MRVLIIIPARGGSKGLCDKNLRCVGGIPLVGRSARVAVAACKRLGGQCKVICSTDNPRIAEAARTWGAEVPFLRPADLASDSARSIDVVFHALDALGENYQTVVLIQPTSPLVAVEDVLGAIEVHQRTGDPVVSVCVNAHPAEWSYRMDSEGRLTPVLPAAPHQRQASLPSCRLNGAVYVASPGDLRANAGFMGRSTRGFVMPAERSVDIDSAADLKIAETLLSATDVAELEIAGHRIGPGRPCFIIAEAGVNHNGDVELARRLVRAAAAAGADAVKFQTFRAERLAAADAPKAKYQLDTTDAGESQWAMLKRLELSADAHRELLALCRELKICFLSSPFDEESADFLEGLGVPAFKIPSGEIVNLPYLRHVARKGKPLIVSTGMAALEEVAAALETIREAGGPPLALLHCVSNYPADPADANLRAMDTMAKAFQVPVGYSDHVRGNEVALAAVALGACVIEKHFTLDRALPGPDHRASIEPDELASLVRGVRIVESALGNGVKRPAASEAGTAAVARKSVITARDLPTGAVLSADMLALKRPGTGLPPASLPRLLGRTLRRAVPKDTLLTLEDLA